LKTLKNEVLKKDLKVGSGEHYIPRNIVIYALSANFSQVVMGGEHRTRENFLEGPYLGAKKEMGL
jgi:hypothetical protein